MGIETAIIGGALTGGSQIFQGIGARKQSKRQASALNQQAEFIRQQAENQRQLGEFEALQQSRSFDRLIGRQKLNIASSGIKLEGSPLDLIAESLKDKEETIENIRRMTESQVRAMQFEAEQLRRQAKDTRRAGRNALIGSVFGAAATGINTFSRFK